MPLATPAALADIVYEASATNARLAPPMNRIHSGILPNHKTTGYSLYVPSSKIRASAPGGQESATPASQPVTRPGTPLFYAPKAPLRFRKSKRPNVSLESNQIDSMAPIKILFSESLLSEPARSAGPSPYSRAPSPYIANKRMGPTSHPDHVYFNSQTFAEKPRARFEESAPRYPQGHKILSRPTVRLTPASRVQQETAVAKKLEAHVKETATAISNLNTQVSSLSTSMEAILPIVAEARLLWMENTVVRAPTKLGTTRQALCQYYDNPRYLTYTGNVRARAHILGLSMHDLKYLQERLGSLGEEHPEQRTARETILLSPFGGGNESGDRVIVESFPLDSRHGVYARKMRRVCYERAYSVNEEWSVPIPMQDNSKLVARIKTWLSST
ncbi:hypothetical protein FRC07_014344 [Ceratobasidium sp. 392]|nr:hypothetical protein FRC07_014344 [Ceratobasidium sp. 392]